MSVNDALGMATFDEGVSAIVDEESAMMSVDEQVVSVSGGEQEASVSVDEQEASVSGAGQANEMKNDALVMVSVTFFAVEMHCGLCHWIVIELVARKREEVRALPRGLARSAFCKHDQKHGKLIQNNIEMLNIRGWCPRRSSGRVQMKAVTVGNLDTKFGTNLRGQRANTTLQPTQHTTSERGRSIFG